MDDFTFDGFEPSNTTPTPDVLFDVLLTRLNEAQLKVLLYIIRRTLGFKKTSDPISLKQFRYGIVTKKGERLDEGCGLKNYTTILNALQSLEKMGCIESNKKDTDKGDKDTTVYCIRFRGTAQNVVPTAPNGVGVLRETDNRTAQDGVRVLRETESQETVIQETVKQKTVQQESSATKQKPTITPIHTTLPSKEIKQEPLLDSILAEPLMAGNWNDEKVVQYTEFRNGRRYAPKMREAQLAAAKWLFTSDKSLTLDTYRQAFDERLDTWWLEHKKVLHVTDMKAKETNSGVMRLYAMLDRIEANKNKPNLRVVSSQQKPEEKLPPKNPTREELRKMVY